MPLVRSPLPPAGYGSSAGISMKMSGVLSGGARLANGATLALASGVTCKRSAAAIPIGHRCRLPRYPPARAPTYVSRISVVAYPPPDPCEARRR